MMDLKRKELDLVRINAARAELEFKILEREEEIARLKEHIKIQTEKEESIRQELKVLKGE